jgi:hypothetical protein
VVNLDEYRRRASERTPTIEIKLIPGGAINYSSSDLRESDAFRALLGCYMVAGELLQTLGEKIKCGTGGSCGSQD